MKTKLKKMLNEFIDRDFTAGEMIEVLDALNDIEEDIRIRNIYRKRGMLDDVVRMIEKEDRAVIYAYNILRKYNLEYEIDELI